MDSVTHIVLGACIGEVMIRKKTGKIALLTGALAQSLPDIDFIASRWLPVDADLLAHRGFTHSFAFALTVSALMAWACHALFRARDVSFRNWYIFWAVQVCSHIVLDSFNAYGTGWFEPFSHYRVSFNSMFVADPLFSIWPAAATVLLLVLKNNIVRKKIATMAIAASVFYLLLGLVFKNRINDNVKNDLISQKISANRWFTTPTPLNNLLWYIVAETDSGYYIGYRSVFDHSGVVFHYVSRNAALLTPYSSMPALQRLERFSDGYYAATTAHDTVLFNDLRFGEQAGWPDPKPVFVLHYYLNYPDANSLVVQRGRFSGWNRAILHAFIQRMAGR